MRVVAMILDLAAMVVGPGHTATIKVAVQKKVGNHLTRHQTIPARSYCFASGDHPKSGVFVTGSRIYGIVLETRRKSFSKSTSAD